ncbi:Signal peptide peptidase-like 2A [Fukomys damarensis]|uniref:Signal peptide peptidase-like 2A n=1 Tax=Fukomys damarensis TaxID=885580 RepID=A0A091DLU7_FUKDA|nr:Signal peptide peptidase-like 2A [Fukomys damarensis]
MPSRVEPSHHGPEPSVPAAHGANELLQTAVQDACIWRWPVLAQAYCTLNNPHQIELPSNLENVTSFSLMTLSTTPLCKLYGTLTSGSMEKKVVGLEREACHFLEKAKIADRSWQKSCSESTQRRCRVVSPPSHSLVEYGQDDPLLKTDGTQAPSSVAEVSNLCNSLFYFGCSSITVTLPG